MNIEWFFKLKEIDSLGKMRINHLKQMKDQENRLILLNEKRLNHLNLISELEINHLQAQQNLSRAEENLLNAEKQILRLNETHASSEKLDLYQKERDQFENLAFEIMEQIDHIQKEITEAKTFIFGLDKTINEISSEVETEKNSLQRDIAHWDLRIQSLQDELPPDFKSILTKTLAKKLPLGPFTRIESGSCFFCRFKISKIDESEIDMQQKIKTCPQCDRIFLPYGS